MDTLWFAKQACCGFVPKNEVLYLFLGDIVCFLHPKISGRVHSKITSFNDATLCDSVRRAVAEIVTHRQESGQAR